MLEGRRGRRWERDAGPRIRALYTALIDLIADIGEPAIVLHGTCARFDRRITELDRWLLGHPCPDAMAALRLRELIGACAGLWATTVQVARRAPAGIDAGAAHLPPACTIQMAERVDALEVALEGVTRIGLL
jgi:hypothetical protein